MDRRDFQQVLSQSYNTDTWKNQIFKQVFNNIMFFNSEQSIDHSNEKIEKFTQLGYISLEDNKKIALFELQVNVNVKLKKNRVELNNVISGKIGDGTYSAAIGIFHQNGSKNYRLTFCGKNTIFDQELWDFKENKTDTKRFTYYGGEGESNRTLAERFLLVQNLGRLSIEDLVTAFNVEKLSKEFFDEYKSQFEKFWLYTSKHYKDLFLGVDKEKQIRDFTKKLLGRIVFLHFLQKKGWMGCDADNSGWINGDEKFMQNLFDNYSKQEVFHSKCLTQLFFNTLNNGNREGQIFNCEFLEGELNNSKIPYLNGGLFDSDVDISSKIDFPVDYFEDLFEFFSHYNFTIDENDPNDHEVGIDPEMLGHIFENLLEDNKDKGAFYTPKVIVQYMCQESLIQYLNTELNINGKEDVKVAISNLIKVQLAQEVNELDLVESIAQALYDVKICDPAIGSGAFPMGILNEIYQIIEMLYWLQPDAVADIWKIDPQKWQPHLVKKNIIQHSIYGVDIESGAIDIARLRFWLALVVDEEEPLPLPNLDYKIMQGNSLMESFEDIDLSKINTAKTGGITSFKSASFSGNFNRKQNIDVQDLMSKYFSAATSELKNDIKKEIDQFVIDYIHEIVETDKKDYEESLRITLNRINEQKKHSTTPEEFKKIENSADFKTAKKIEKKLNEIINKEIEIFKLINSTDRPFFLWGLYFKEVFEDHGFDIVIGNPPYLSNKGVTDEIKNEYGIKDDLYNYFFIKGDQILKENGIFCFITSNTFLTLQSKSNIRELILQKELINISNLGYNIFESAMVPTAITIYRKHNCEENIVEFIDARGGKKLLTSKKYYINRSEYLNTPNNVLFTPNEENLQIHNHFSKQVKGLLDNYWELISTSKNITKNHDKLEKYRNSLSSGDITLLGLVTDGGQGLATANNGKFVGIRKGTKEADRVITSRVEKLNEFNKKNGTNHSIKGKSENEIRNLFDELKEEYGRDSFGQGYLFRIVDENEIADVNKLSAKEQKEGIESTKSFVPYDKGDKDGNRWYLETPYVIDWNTENVNFLYKNSGKKGKGMPVVRNPQFFFREGICWTNVLNENSKYIKARFKDKTINDVGSMSLYPNTDNLSSKYIVCLLNSFLLFSYLREMINSTVNLQVNDFRRLPIVVPNKEELKFFESYFDQAYQLQLEKFSGKKSSDFVKNKLDEMQEELDKAVVKLYFKSHVK